MLVAFLLYIVYYRPITASLRLPLMAEESLAKRFGELVRRKRLERGYSQEDFSFRSGLHQTYVSGIERGRRNVTLETADRLAKALGTTLSSMFSELEGDPHDSGRRSED